MCSPGASLRVAPPEEAEHLGAALRCSLGVPGHSYPGAGLTREWPHAERRTRMFDIGFSEIVVIAVVALIVIGPERLPKTARTLGHLFGRLQRYVSEVKADINRELELDELRKLQTQVQSAAREFETSMSNVARDVETGVRDVEAQLNAAGSGSPASQSEPATAEASAPLSAPPAPAAQTASEGPRQATLPGFDRG